MSTTRVVLVIALMLGGCTGPTRSEVDLAEVLKDEIRPVLQRHERRERARARGLRVCEEGEWQQRWQEDCNMCHCDVGQIRSCTKAHCHNTRKNSRLP